MDFTNAALLIGAVFGITELVKRIFPKLIGAAVQAVAIAVGVGVTFLVANSDYASSQIVGGRTLDDVNVASLVLIGLLLGGGATVAHQIISAIPSIGENQPDPPSAAQ